MMAVTKKPKRKASTPRVGLKPTVEIVDMTPEWAEELLATNEQNRNIREGRVSELVRAIEVGEWTLNGATICTDFDGNLIDGQHRLLAIARAERTVPTVLFTGVTIDDQLTIDTGSARKFSDALTMRGEMNATVLGATTRLFAGYKIFGNVPGGGHAWRGLSHTELLRTLDKNPKLRESVEIGRAAHRMSGISETSLAFTHRLLSEVDVQDTAFFFEHLASGAGLRKDNGTVNILKLRQWGLNKTSHESRSRRLVIGTIFKAWNKYRDGETNGTVVYRVGGANPEPWPAPR